VGVGTLDDRGSVGVGTLDDRGSVGVGTLLKVDSLSRSMMYFKVSPTENLVTTKLFSFILKSLSIEERAGSRASSLAYHEGMSMCSVWKWRWNQVKTLIRKST